MLDEGFDALWPIMRSITGPGLKASYDWFAQHMPLTVETVPTGERVFDWTVPPEWQFRRAVLTGPDGEVVCDTEDSTLHVVNYSAPVDRELSLEDLQPHLHSIPHLPTAVPYVTSYYKRTWGFCLAHERREALRPGRYHARVDAAFVDGGVPFAHAVLEGESEREVLLTSYLCHPSLANNELSGPLTLLALYRRLAAWPRRRYTYRFLLNPETIGALCFLSRYREHLDRTLESGLILTCVGGRADGLRYKASRPGDALLDHVAALAEGGAVDLGCDLRTEPFTPLGGSDERQYGAPGFKLPVGQIARDVYGQYAGYHNSLDTKAYMGIDRLVETADAVERMLQYAEVCGRPVSLAPFGEPQLGRRGLYPNMNDASTPGKSADGVVDGRTNLDRRLTLLSLADGEHRLAEIAAAAGCAVDDLVPHVETLESAGLLAYGRPLPAPPEASSS